MPKPHPEAEAKQLICGSCQWFTAGFGGKNCQITRQVSINTTACVEYQKPLADPFQALASDKVIQEIRGRLREPKFTIDHVAILDELKSYIVGEQLGTNQFGTRQDIEGICDHLRRVVTYRARISTIYTSLLDIRHDYEELVGYAHSWLYTKYQVVRDLKNEMSREAVFSRLFPESVRILRDLNKSTTVAKYLDEKLESAERTLGRILSSSEKLWFSREIGGGQKWTQMNQS
jgi:hypothetical protein